jgi:hypothetical protein
VPKGSAEHAALKAGDSVAGSDHSRTGAVTFTCPLELAKQLLDIARTSCPDVVPAVRAAIDQQTHWVVTTHDRPAHVHPLDLRRGGSDYGAGLNKDGTRASGGWQLGAGMSLSTPRKISDSPDDSQVCLLGTTDPFRNRPGGTGPRMIGSVQDSPG